MWETKKQLFTCIGGAILFVLLMQLCSCSTVNLDEEGHWPGYIVEPYYGPHDSQVQLRNAYSDGWQDAVKSGKGRG